ncbi:MAG TPA: hypothetical protein VII90_04195, partial [Anaerolineales bacterium]
MLRILKYLKPYLWLILIAVGLLFVQANADLALPDYMSKIVNNGIQQGGVENAVPKAIRQSEMNKLVVFLSADNKALVLGDYTLVDNTSSDYAKYLKDYPALAQGPIYVLKAVDAAEIKKLNPIIGKGLLVIGTIETVMADPAKAAAMAQGLGFDLTKIPAGMDIFTVLAHLPPAQLATMTSAIDTKFSALGDSMINQMAVGIVKTEYTALGINTEKLQTDYIIHTGILMLLLTLLSGTCTIIVGFLSARTAAGVARDLRR